MSFFLLDQQSKTQIYLIYNDMKHTKVENSHTKEVGTGEYLTFLCDSM